MHSRIIGKDSVKIFYNQFYDVIEPGCAYIIRYVRLDPSHRYFTGKFKDVSKFDTSLTVAQGSYSNNGLKNGEFIISFLNGAPQARGFYNNGNFQGSWVFYGSDGRLRLGANFVNGHYDGECMFYYDNGSPHVHMTITGDTCTILDVWDENGKKVVDKGNGDYTFYDGALTWQGQLKNGLPDGFWGFQSSDEVYGNEKFDNGKFVKGRDRSTVGDQNYTDKSRIHFMPRLPDLNITKSEQLIIFQRSPCDTTKYIRQGNVIKYKVVLFD